MKLLSALGAAALLVLVGCSSSAGADGGDSGAPFEFDAEPVETTEVAAAKSYKFEPAVIEITEGSEVTWTNEDDFPHNVHLLTGSDETHDLPIGETVSLSFDQSGEFYYECSIHPDQMRGLVIVTQ